MSYRVKVIDNIKLQTFGGNPQLKKRIDEAIVDVLWEVRNRASNDVYSYMKNDPRGTFNAVHHSVYRKVMGGNLNILTQRKALRMERIAPSTRGRSRKTEQMLSYSGPDRGMILRWINKGTRNRYTVRMDGHPMYRNSVNERPKSRDYVFPHKLGGRGGAAKVNTRTINMFDKAIAPKMDEAEAKLNVMIDEIIDEMFY